MIVNVNVQFYDDHITLRAVDNEYYTSVPCVHNPASNTCTISVTESMPGDLSYMKSFEITGDDYLRVKYGTLTSDHGKIGYHPLMSSDIIDVKAIKHVMSGVTGSIDVRTRISHVSDDVKYEAHVTLTISKYQNKWYMTSILATLDKDISDIIFTAFVKKLNQRDARNYSQARDYTVTLLAEYVLYASSILLSISLCLVLLYSIL